MEWQCPRCRAPAEKDAAVPPTAYDGTVSFRRKHGNATVLHAVGRNVRRVGCNNERLPGGLPSSPPGPPAVLVSADEGRNFFLLRKDRVAKEEGIEVEGSVTDVLPDRKYRVLLENGRTVLAYGAGKLTKFKIRVLPGDRVTLVLSPYDLTRGRITFRHKS